MWPKKKWVIVFSLMKDKNLPGMARLLLPLASRVYVVPAGGERTRDPEATCRLLTRHGLPCSWCGDIAEGIRRANGEAGSKGRVLITGSLFLVAAAMKLARRENRSGISGKTKRETASLLSR
jgi:folylpolyglutamate synthase/dihydropteroate synthase